jgi:hypothetical protein
MGNWSHKLVVNIHTLYMASSHVRAVARRQVLWLIINTLTESIIGGTRQRSWLRHYATSRKVAVSSPNEVDFFFNVPYHSSRPIALGSTQSLTEMSTRNLPGGKGLLARKAEPIVYKIWEPWRLTTLWAFTACCRDKFYLFTQAIIASIHIDSKSFNCPSFESCVRSEFERLSLDKPEINISFTYGEVCVCNCAIFLPVCSIVVTRHVNERVGET